MKKKILIALGILLALVIAGLTVLVLTLDSTIKKAVEEGGSYALKVPVKLEKVSLSLTGGQVTLRGFEVGNPQGFKTPRALYLGEVSTRVAISSLNKDVIEIPEIVLRRPEITIEGSMKGSNLQRLLKNLDETLAEYASPDEEPAGEPLHFNVGRILIEDAKLSLSATFMGGREASATLPKIEVKDLDSRMTMAEIFKRVLSEVVKASAKRPDQIGKMMGGLAVNSGLGVIDGAGKVVKGVGKGVGEAVKGVGKGVGEVVKGVGKGVGEIGKGIGNIFKKKEEAGGEEKK